jgi:hypothetical protein
VNGVFELALENAAGQTQSWALDFKSAGSVALGKPEGKTDVVISMAYVLFGFN